MIINSGGGSSLKPIENSYFSIDYPAFITAKDGSLKIASTSLNAAALNGLITPIADVDVAGDADYGELLSITGPGIFIPDRSTDPLEVFSQSWEGAQTKRARLRVTLNGTKNSWVIANGGANVFRYYRDSSSGIYIKTSFIIELAMEEAATGTTTFTSNSGMLWGV